MDANGVISKQVDMVIYDRTAATVFNIADRNYFACETVIAVGEVKASIRSRDVLVDALDKVASVKRLDRSNTARTLTVQSQARATRSRPRISSNQRNSIVTKSSASSSQATL